MVEEHLPVFGKGLAVALERFCYPREKVGMPLICPVVDQRRIVFDHRQFADHFGEFGKVVLCDGLLTGFGQPFSRRWSSSSSEIFGSNTSASRLEYQMFRAAPR